MHRLIKPMALCKGCLLVLIFLSTRAFSQLVPVTLDERVEKANAVFEGKVVSQSAVWDNAHKHIYTLNVVDVYKVFKGTLAAERVELITYGGTVAHDMETVSHSLQLAIGEVGVFTAITSPYQLPQTSGLLQFKAYAGMQGFIKYDLTKHTAADPFNKYKSIIGEVYPSLTTRTKATMRTLKKADYKVE